MTPMPLIVDYFRHVNTACSMLRFLTGHGCPMSDVFPLLIQILPALRTACGSDAEDRVPFPYHAPVHGRVEQRCNS